MSAWDDYLAAAQRLDGARHEAGALVTRQSAAATGARAELNSVRQRIALQRGRLAALMTGLNLGAPDATPHPDELATARASLPGTDPAVAVAALRDSRARLDAADAVLSTIDNSRVRGGSVTGRNAVLYTSLAVLTVLIPLITYRSSSSTYVLLPTIGCAAVLPVIGYLVAWLLTGLVSRPGPGGRVERNALLGAALTVGTVVFLYAIYLLLVVMRAI